MGILSYVSKTKCFKGFEWVQSALPVVLLEAMAYILSPTTGRFAALTRFSAKRRNELTAYIKRGKKT
jgi:hypothetical protein